MTHGVLDVLEGHAGAEQLGGEAVSQAVGAEPAGCGDAGLASHATDQGVAGRVREPGGAVPVEKDRPGRAGPDAVLETTRGYALPTAADRQRAINSLPIDR
jgi:hypothetical protein